MRVLLVTAALAAAAAPAAAGEFPWGGNSGALARPFALPGLGDGAVLPAGRAETRLSYDVANEYVSEGDCAIECIVLDGETSRLRFGYRAGLGDGWDASLHVQGLQRDGGFLDGWIQDWHRWFGLPNGGREQRTDGQFEYRYQRGATVLLDETVPERGVGDVAIGLGRALGTGSALRGLVKLDTGDGALGGGNVGGAVWLDAAFEHGYFAAGYSRNERGDVLAALQNQEVWFGGVGLLLPVTGAVSLSLQLNAHTRLYDGSELTPLARPGLPLTIGLRFRTGPEGALDVGFQEDPSVNGSPDFVFYVSLARIPRR